MKRVEITDSILQPWRDARPDTRIRFHFTGRYADLGLTDNYIEVTYSRDGDAVTVRSGYDEITLGHLGGSSVDIAPQGMFGGGEELLRLRKREIELVGALDEARDVFGKRKKAMK
jgi:hypothetical protein